MEGGRSKEEDFSVNQNTNASKEEEEEVYVYRISTGEEWEELQIRGSTLGGQIDKSTGCIHLSKLHQVQCVLENFFINFKEKELYLLQIDAEKLGNGLVYEAVNDSNVFPHFYGPSRSFIPLPLYVVTKAEKLILLDGKFTCGLLSGCGVHHICSI